jgi:tungstate transport system substrate-binding protein
VVPNGRRPLRLASTIRPIETGPLPALDDRMLRTVPVAARLLLAACLGLLAACGPTQPPAATPPAVPPSAMSAAPRPTAVPRSGSAKELILATTTSTQDSGLLDVLVPRFEQQAGYTVKTVAVGTGAALALGARGQADVVLVHAPASEQQWMAQGYGTERLLVMHSDFLIVGPEADPAHIKGDASALDALRTIADAKAPFVSRGDNSGTHQLELSLWQQDKIDPKGRPWYVEGGTGMGQTLTIADQKRAYTITDRATWLAFTGKIQLPVMVEKDPLLLNVYHVMPVNPAKFPNLPINAAGGQAFAEYMVAPATQQVIGDFGKDNYGQQLFVPDAGKSESEVGL